MTLSEHCAAFARLGKALSQMPAEEQEALAQQAYIRNPWFTPENIALAFEGVQKYLEEEALQNWVKPYELEPSVPKNIGVVMAGNIPMVGFHDLLAVLISGHRLHGKLSQKDEVLLPFLVQKLIEIEPRFAHQVHWTEQLKEADAYIATGSNNSARYFSYYFSSKPHIIRKNRTAWAVLEGNETEEELLLLGRDAFTYFGLGCRNVSRLCLPEGFDMVALLDVWQEFVPLADHNKYGNNYDYQRGIRLMNQEPIYDSGFVVLEENTEGAVAPTGMLYYQFYQDKDALQEEITAREAEIQCVVSRKGDFLRGVPFGEAQKPALADYADGVDTLDFLQKL